MTVSISKTASRVKNRDEDAESKTKLVLLEPKTEKGSRLVPINKVAEKVLREQEQRDGVFVFSSRVNSILMARNINRAFNVVLEAAGLPKDLSVHSLQHSFATRLLEKGANIKAVSEILGHSSIQVTLDIYSHALPNLKKDTISLLD